MPNSGRDIVVSHPICAAARHSDEDLAALAGTRDPASAYALEALLRRHEGSVYRSCLSYLRDVDLAEEACQEALIRVYRGIDRFQGRSTFRTWLYRIVRNECYSLAAHQARHRACDSLDETSLPADEFDFAAGIERDDAVGAALRQLKPHDKEVIVLRFFHDLSLDTIADRLGTSLSGAKMRLYRAIARFERVYLELEPRMSASLAA